MSPGTVSLSDIEWAMMNNPSHGLLIITAGEIVMQSSVLASLPLQLWDDIVSLTLREVGRKRQIVDNEQMSREKGGFRWG